MKTYKRYLMPISITMILSGCMVGPDFEKPAPPASQEYTLETDLNTFGSQRINHAKAISESWWDEFRSSDLNKVVDYGVKNSHSLASVQETVEQAIEQVNAQKGQLWPQLSLDVAGGRQYYGVALFGPATVRIPPFTYYEVGPSLTYLLDVFGGTRRAIEKQKALAEYQGYVYNATYLNLTGSMVSTALDIAIINAQIDAANDIIKEDKSTLKMVKTAFEIGSTTKTEVLTAQSQLTNDEAMMPQLYQHLSETKNALNVLVSQTPVDWQPPHFHLNNFTLPKELPLSLPSQMVRSRPDIQAAEAVLHAASADVGIATANLYPNIMLTGALLQEALTPGTLFNASSTAWSYLASLSAPLFTGGTLRAQKRAAEHAFESSYDNYQQVVVKAFVQVNDVLHALKLDAEAERLQKEAVDTAKASLKLSRLSYEAGNVGLLQVLDAERLYKKALLAHVKAKGQRYQDTVQLYLALGGRSELETAMNDE